MRLKFTAILITIFLLITASYPKVPLIIDVTCENKQDFPYLTGNSTALHTERPGIAIELLKMIESELDVKFRFKRNPWKRCFFLIGNNDADALVYASYNADRKKYGIYPMKGKNIDSGLSMLNITYALYTKKGSEIRWDGNYIYNITGSIGAPVGYSIVTDLLNKGYDVDESPETLIDFKKLMINRLAAVAALEMTADYYLRNNREFSENIVKLSPVLTEKPYFILFSNKFYRSNSEVAHKIWKRLAELKDSGMVESLMKKYMGMVP